MSPTLTFPAVELGALLPALVVALTAGVVLLLDLLPPRDSKDHLGAVALAGVVAALAVTVWLWWRGVETRGFGDMVILDAFALFFAVVVAYAAGLALLLSIDYIRRQTSQVGEYYALVLFAATGMMLLASARDLIVIFLALELMSISLYVLAGYFKTRLASSEASMKYFLLGAFASGFLLYGIAMLYGATGSTSLDRIAVAVAAADRSPLVLTGLGLLIVGFGFKISSVPFHMWVPDVYEGAPTAVTALIATGSKAGAFAALIRVLAVGLGGLQADWSALFWALAVLTMTLGNVVALAQGNLKRMLAYSSIAHVGYMLVGLVAGGTAGAGAVLFYLLAYTFTTAGAFGVIALSQRMGEEAVEVGDYAGLARRHPLVAAVLALCLLSLIGIPPLAGFMAKVYLFGSAVRAGFVWLAVIAVLNSAVAAYYYLRVIVYMYMRDVEGEGAEYAPSLAGSMALAIAVAGIVLLGVLPAPFADLTQAAVAPLLR